MHQPIQRPAQALWQQGLRVGAGAEWAQKASPGCIGGGVAAEAQGGKQALWYHACHSEGSAKQAGKPSLVATAAAFTTAARLHYWYIRSLHRDAPGVLSAAVLDVQQAALQAYRQAGTRVRLW